MLQVYGTCQLAKLNDDGTRGLMALPMSHFLAHFGRLAPAFFNSHTLTLSVNVSILLCPSLVESGFNACAKCHGLHAAIQAKALKRTLIHYGQVGPDTLARMPPLLACACIMVPFLSYGHRCYLEATDTASCCLSARSGTIMFYLWVN